MSKRIQIVLPEPVARQLHELAVNAGEPPARLAGQMVRHCVDEAARDGKVRALKSAPVVVGGDGQRPGWLEPYGGDISWRMDLWGAIAALHGRYPESLEALRDEWWTSEERTEMLCALATWRAQIDDSGTDPREELAFHAQLADFAHTLRQTGGGATQAWTPGAPPAEWAST